MADTRAPFRNRIVATGVKPASDFLANPHNWRIHPQAQQAALEGVLSDIGWCQGVIENVTTGHLIDGHQRVLSAMKQGDDTPVPFVQVELTPSEEDLLLATFDPISSMAVADRNQLNLLLARVSTTDQALTDLVQSLAKPVQTRTVEFEVPSEAPATCPTCGQKLSGHNILTAAAVVHGRTRD